MHTRISPYSILQRVVSMPVHMWLISDRLLAVFFPNFALNSPDFIEFMERKMDGLHLVDLGICAPLLYRSSQRLLKVACNQV